MPYGRRAFGRDPFLAGRTRDPRGRFQPRRTAIADNICQGNTSGRRRRERALKERRGGGRTDGNARKRMERTRCAARSGGCHSWVAPTTVLLLGNVAVEGLHAWFVSDFGVDAAVGAFMSSAAADSGPMTFEFRQEPGPRVRKEARNEKRFRFGKCVSIIPTFNHIAPEF